MKEEVAEKIRLTRLTKNLSQQNVADEIGLTVAAYSNIERGITDISITRLFQIAEVLKANPFSFLKNENEYLINDVSKQNETFQSSLTQQVFMLIQQNQTLNTRVELLEHAVLTLRMK